MARLHRGHRDPTFDNAVGSVDREWKEMAKLAVRIRDERVNPVWAEQQSKRFTGIYRRLLEDPIDEVKIEAKRGI